MAAPARRVRVAKFIGERVLASSRSVTSST
jgi:hypothetical protein